jgi:uncharacterized protein YndB with AHSA1/START domain
MRVVHENAYAATITVAASAERVFDALTTLDGLAGWWAPTITGDPREGGDITFAFGDERVVMRAHVVDAPRTVAWTCLAHSRFPEWDGTRLVFDLHEHGAGRTEVSFAHHGLVPVCDCYGHCSRGWDHYLASLAGYAAGTGGSPWGTETWRPARR